MSKCGDPLPEGWRAFSGGEPAETCFRHYRRLNTLTLGTVRALLATQGLHVITTEQKAVLEAMASATDKDLGRGHRGEWTVRVLDAELARRKP